LKEQGKFFKTVKNSHEIEQDFFDHLSPKLAEIRKGIFFLVGMYDDNTVELILTSDGNTKNIPFVEDLVNSAPNIDGWRITAHKPAMNIENVNISMNGYEFNAKNLSFYANEVKDYPDEIDITVVHNDLTEENQKQITTGTYIFLENYLGELDFLTNIDTLKTVGKNECKKDLIPIAKLKDFIVWRQKEFIEKYNGIRHNTANDEHSTFESDLKDGNKLFAVINTDLLNWDSKASHPWIAAMTIKYDGTKSNGMPTDKDYKLLDKIEDELMQELTDIDGNLNLGRQTACGEREIYFACTDFRKPSKIFFKLQQRYLDIFAIDYDIYKDKYWQSFERFNN